MAIDLLNSFLKRAQDITSGQNSAASKATQTSQNFPQNLQVMRVIRALQAGQTIQGEVVSIKGDEVQLAIMKDVIIDARLAQTMNLTTGMMMPFQVKANTSQGLSLIPLFTNTAADPNALKALDMAQIPVNDRSLEMVQTLMEKGMPIDKQSIQEMYREVMAFKDAAVRDIVSMHQMKIPVNGENLKQFSLYQNNQHYLKDTFYEIGNAIGEQLENLVAEGKTENAGRLVMQLQQLFQKGAVTSQISSDVAANTDNAVANPELQKVIVSEGDLSNVLTEHEESAKVSLKAIEAEGSEEVQIANEAENKKSALFSDKNTQSQDMWKDLTEVLFKEKNPGKISEVFDKVWKKEISNQWFLEPDMVADKDNVKSFYEKLENQIKQLEKIFEESQMLKSPAGKAVQNTASNLDFMNQLNQMHAYIQLPLKMANQNAHGELYVFTNKKNLSKQDGKVTALLHLDMDHLGKMDIYVALENQKVNTNFYLEREEYLAFLEEHMDLLTARLNRRGYTCDIKTMLRNTDEESVLKSIEKQMEHPVMLSMQAFDVRA